MTIDMEKYLGLNKRNPTKAEVETYLNALEEKIKLARWNLEKHPGIIHISLQNIIFNIYPLKNLTERLRKNPLQKEDTK